MNLNDPLVVAVLVVLLAVLVLHLTKVALFSVSWPVVLLVALVVLIVLARR